MRVFVAGATGAIGSRLVPMLVAAGHAVTGLTRSPDKVEWLEQAGAAAAVADGLDAAAVAAAVAAAQPEVIVHQMTALAAIDLRRFDRSFAVSNRLRTEGLDHLMAAGREAGVRRIVAQSYCGWPYARIGGMVKSEGDPLDPEPPAGQRVTLAAIRYLERTVTGASDIEGVVLRYGALYGPGTGVLDPAAIAEVRRRRFPLIGAAGGWWSFVHVDDAAAATALAVEGGAPGIYNIVDDEPAPVEAWLPALAGMLGAARPWRIPAWLGRLVAGAPIVTMMTASRAGSNAKARQALGWAPAHPSWRRGFAEVLAEGA